MEVGVSRLFLLYGGGGMKQITNKEYEEWMKYKEEKAKGYILLPDTIRFICEANDMDPGKIGRHFLEVLPRICPKQNE